jgi:hypothetical protein
VTNSTRRPNLDIAFVARKIGAMSTAAKPFDYAAFIEELRVLRDSFSDQSLIHRTYDADEFKLWRHQLSDLIDRIEARGYDINCHIRGRQFRVFSYSPITQREQQAVFDRALADTMIELGTIINNFERYGDPGAATPTSAPIPTPSQDFETKQPLEWRKEATLSWYFKHTPAATLWTIGAVVSSLIVGAFFLGIFVEKRLPEAKPAVTSVPAAKVLPQDHASSPPLPPSAGPK